MNSKIFIVLFTAATLFGGTIGCDKNSDTSEDDGGKKKKKKKKKKKSSDDDDSDTKKASDDGGDYPKECQEYFDAVEKCKPKANMDAGVAALKTSIETMKKAMKDSGDAGAKAMIPGCKTSMQSVETMCK